MASLNQFPNELHMAVAGYLRTGEGEADLSALSCLARTCKFFHGFVGPILFKEGHNKYPGLLCWATEVGNIGAMKMLLVNQIADPNLPLVFSHETANYEPWTRSSSNAKERWDFYRRLKGPLTRLDYDPYTLENDPSDDDPPEDEEEPEPRQEKFAYPVHLAAIHGDFEAFDLLLTYGAYSDAPSHAICQGCDMKELDAYYEWLIFEYFVPFAAWTSFHFALCHGHDELTKHMLQRHPTTREDFRERGQDPMPAFISAVRHGRLDLADFLLSSGIENVHSKYPRFRFGMLMWLSYWLDILKLALPVLLRHGADVDADLVDGHTLLIETCCRATYREAILFIEK